MLVLYPIHVFISHKHLLNYHQLNQDVLFKYSLIHISHRLFLAFKLGYLELNVIFHLQTSKC